MSQIEKADLLSHTWQLKGFKSFIPNIDQFLKDVEAGVREVLLGLGEQSENVIAARCCVKEEFEAFCQQLLGNLLKHVLVSFGNSCGKDHRPIGDF